MSTDRKYLAIMLGALAWSAIGGSVGYASTLGDVTVVFSDDLRKLRKERQAEIAICRQILRRRASLDRFLDTGDIDPNRLSQAARRLWNGDGCQQDRSLAIGIMDHVVGPEPLKAPKGDAIEQLASYLSSRGEVADIDRSIELRRVMWLRDGYFPDLPPIQWSPGELRAFLARQDVWTYLNRQDERLDLRQEGLLFAAVSDPESPRFDRDRSVAFAETERASSEQKLRAARLLLPAVDRSDNANRAEALLTSAARYSEEARSLFLDLIQPRLGSDDRAVRDNAIAHLSSWSDLQTPTGMAARAALTPLFIRDLSSPDDGVKVRAVSTLTDYVIRGTKEAELPLLGWMDRALQRGGGPLKNAALRETSRLIAEQNPLGRRILNAELSRHGGLVQAGQVSREQGNLASVFTGDNYPNHSLRAEEEGVVEASAILSPDGFVLAMIVARSASPALDKAAERLLLQRVRGIRPAGFSGRYVQVQLPPIQFMLNECQKDAPVVPVVRGALLMKPTHCPQSQPPFPVQI